MSDRDAGAGRAPSEDPDDGLVDLYVAGLRRSQLGLSWIAVVGLLGLVGALPLVALLVPGLDGATVGQVPIIALLPLLPFPAFLLVAILHERRATGLDREFGRLDAAEGTPPWAPRGIGGPAPTDDGLGGAER